MNKIEELIYYHYDFDDNILSPKLETYTLIYPPVPTAILIDSDVRNIFAAEK